MVGSALDTQQTAEIRVIEFAPAIILARKYGIIDLISRAILPEIIELKVELAHVSRLLGEIARSLPLGRNLNQEIVSESEKLGYLHLYCNFFLREVI